MKILAGKYRGNKIISAKHKELRPTSGLIKEVIFNLLLHGKFMKTPDFIRDDNSSLIENRYVVDIFCGSGAMGLEALSRGAAHVVFVDQNQQMLDMVKESVSKIGANNISYIRSDSANLPRAAKKCGLAFVDPPYGRNLALPALKTLHHNGWLEKGAVIVLEREKGSNVEIPGYFRVADDRTHGKTQITILQYLE